MHLRLPDTAIIYGEDGTVIPNGSGAELCLIQGDGILSVKITASAVPLCFVKLKWLLSKTEKRDAASVKVLGDAWERGYGDMEWRSISEDRAMPWYFSVSNGSDARPERSGRFTECFGVKVRPSAFCHWNYSADELTLTLDIRSGGCGVRLGGRTLHAADIVFAEYGNTSAYEATCSFCEKMCSVGIFPTSPVFGFNDWYFSYGHSNREAILASAHMLAERANDCKNTPYMVIDDGWQKNFNDGPWDVSCEAFGDMSTLASEITALGLKPGIWIRPLYQRAKNKELSEEMKLSRSRDCLDPSRPDVLAYVTQCIERVVSWGYRLIKYDFVTYDIFGKWGFEAPASLAEDGWSFCAVSKTSAEIILKLYETIRAAAGDAVLIGCNAIGHLCAGLVEVNRTGDDTSGKDWERTLKMGVNTLAFRSPQNRRFYMADADCAGITDSIPFSQNEKWLRMLSVSGSPLFVSISPDTSDGDVKNAVRRALERSSEQDDTLVPLDWMETKIPCRWLLNGKEITVNWNEEYTSPDLAHVL